MAKSSNKMQSWQVFHFARKHLGAALLCTVFGKKNARTVNYWCEDPAYTAKNDFSYDPIFGVKQLADKLDDRGHTDVVRALRSFLFGDTSLDDGDGCGLGDLQPTMVEEKLCDYQTIGELHNAITSKADPAEVERMKREAIAEIERTVALYIKEYDNGD